MRHGHELSRQLCLTRLTKGRRAAALRRVLERYLVKRGVAKDEIERSLADFYDGVARLVALWQRDQITVAARRKRSRAGMSAARKLRDVAAFLDAQPGTVFQRQRWITSPGPEPLAFATGADRARAPTASKILRHLATHAELEFNSFGNSSASLQRFLISCLDTQLRYQRASGRVIAPNQMIEGIVGAVLSKRISAGEVKRVVGPSRRRRLPCG